MNIGSTPSSISHAANVAVDKLFPHYSHVVLASGCTVPKLHPSLPPSEVCKPAISLVHWYTMHPSLPPIPSLEKTSHVTLVGHGNVSLDIARILLCDPAYLSKYDVPAQVLEVLERSSVKHVSIVGRRGPLEASFTTKELREMMSLPNASLQPIDESAFPSHNDKPLTRQQTRLLGLLKEGSKQKFGTTRKTWSLEFFRSPTGISKPTDSLKSTTQIHLAHTILDANQRAVPNGESSSIPTDLVVTSLGYHSEPSHAWYEPGLGHLRNTQGRVISAKGKYLKNIYTSGWAATGAKGVLASTMLNAHSLVETIISDILPGSQADSRISTNLAIPTAPDIDIEADSVLNPQPDLDDVPSLIRDARLSGAVFDYDQWKRVDDEEILRGQQKNKERERMSWA